MEQEYIKSSAFATFFHRSNPFLTHKSTSRYIPYTMRFTSNAFIISTAALLSLITPGVNAADATSAVNTHDSIAVITTPSAGQTVNAFDSIVVAWYVLKMENPSAVCHHRSLTVCITAGP